MEIFNRWLNILQNFLLSEGIYLYTNKNIKKTNKTAYLSIDKIVVKDNTIEYFFDIELYWSDLKTIYPNLYKLIRKICLKILRNEGMDIIVSINDYDTELSYMMVNIKFTYTEFIKSYELMDEIINENYYN